jgi:hypothetical protein
MRFSSNEVEILALRTAEIPRNIQKKSEDQSRFRREARGVVIERQKRKFSAAFSHAKRMHEAR